MTLVGIGQFDEDVDDADDDVVGDADSSQLRNPSIGLGVCDDRLVKCSVLESLYLFHKNTDITTIADNNMILIINFTNNIKIDGEFICELIWDDREIFLCKSAL
jgi:hypothetical protein